MEKSHKWGVLSATSLGSLLSALNFSTLIIALPDLIRGLHASVLQAMWIMLSYMVAQTIVVLMAGSLGDRYGRKRLYISGMIIFTLVSFVSGFLHDASWLIFCRVLQGIGGAMVTAISTALVADAFPRKELGRALGVNVMVIAVGQIVGPVLGGWLTTYFGWQWTFWFNVPFGIVAVLWAIWILGFSDKNPVQNRKQIDVWGNITYVLGVTGFLLVCTWGPIQTWNSPVVWVAALFFVICTPIFFKVERQHQTPLLHLPLFANRIFSLGILSATLNAVARMAIMFMLIFYFQGAEGFDALQAGILSTPMAIGMLVFSPLSGWISDRYGETLPASGGLFLSMVGLVGLALETNLNTPYWHLALWMTLVGIGSGLFNSPNSSSLMNAAGAKRRGEASGIRSLTANMGMMLSIAFTMPMITSSIPHEEMLAIFSGTAVGIHGASEASLQGFINGVHLVFWVMAGFMLVATVVSSLRASHKNKSIDSPFLKVIPEMEREG